MINGIGHHFLISTGYTSDSKAQLMRFDQMVNVPRVNTVNTDYCTISDEARRLYESIMIEAVLQLEESAFNQPNTNIESVNNDDIVTSHKQLSKLSEALIYHDDADMTFHKLLSKLTDMLSEAIESDDKQFLKEFIEWTDEVLKILNETTSAEILPDEEEENFEIELHFLENSTIYNEKNAIHAAWYEALKKVEADPDSIIGKIKAAMIDAPTNNEFVSKWSKLVDQIEEKETKKKDEEARLAFIEGLANMKLSDLPSAE